MRCRYFGKVLVAYDYGDQILLIRSLSLMLFQESLDQEFNLLSVYRDLVDQYTEITNS